MKKIAPFIALLALSAYAMAQTTTFDWRKISETRDGVALLFNTTDFYMGKNEEGTNVVVGRFKFVPGESESFVYLTTPEACAKGEGPILRRVFDATRNGGEWVTVDHNWWSVGGVRMFDVAGKFLCDVAINMANKQKPQEQKPQQSTPKKDQKPWPKSSGTRSNDA